VPLVPAVPHKANFIEPPFAFTVHFLPTSALHRHPIAKMARAFDTLTLERGRLGITHSLVGTINIYQLAEWATAHIARHNKQAKRVLGES